MADRRCLGRDEILKNPPTLRSRVYGVWEITFPSCFPSFSVLVVLSFQDLVLLFCCFQGGSGRGVGTPDILVGKSSASRGTPPPSLPPALVQQT